MPESVLHLAWSSVDGERRVIEADDGSNYRVLYPGMPGGSVGPDFRDAVLESADGTESVGDLEVHVDPYDWQAHGHHQDHRYSNVMFHAVTGGLDGAPAFNVHGMRVPSIDIGALAKSPPNAVVKKDDAFAAVDARYDRDWLDEAGDERFAMKVRMLRHEIESYGADLALQLAVFECLGYSRNRAAFRQLGQRLPWPYLARWSVMPRRVAVAGDLETRMSEIFDWAAGFGARPHEIDVPRLAGDAPQWSSVSGRPSNRPQARVRGAAALACVWIRNAGPARHAVNAVRRSERATQLRGIFTIRDASIGCGRAGDIVVNAVLPFVAAWSELRRDDALYRAARHCFAHHPALPDNAVIREAARMLGRRGFNIGRLKTARQQQGLMQAYKRMLLRPRATRQLSLGHKVPSV